jgi:hypothetical protein
VPNHDHNLRDMLVKSNVHKRSFVLLSWSDGEPWHLELISVVTALTLLSVESSLADSVFTENGPAPLL